MLNLLIVTKIHSFMTKYMKSFGIMDSKHDKRKLVLIIFLQDFKIRKRTILIREIILHNISNIHEFKCFYRLVIEVITNFYVKQKFAKKLGLANKTFKGNQQIVTKLSGSHKYELSDDPLCWRSI